MEKLYPGEVPQALKLLQEAGFSTPENERIIKSNPLNAMYNARQILKHPRPNIQRDFDLRNMPRVNR